MIKQRAIFDLHCDLTSYLSETANAHHSDIDGIGCASPYLKEGNVKLQVLAIYSPTEKGSTEFAKSQLKVFHQLCKEPEFFPVSKFSDLNNILHTEGTGIVLSIENASGLGEEDDPLEKIEEQLRFFVGNSGRIFYIGFTHHHENRFGGGNKTSVGLKPTGEALLEWMDELNIAVDLSHASDALAHDIINYIDKKGLRVSILASHSNFRNIWDHARNLPDEIAKEIVHRKGLIGMNFLREYVDRKNPQALEEHILHGFRDLNALDSMVFGADYFHVAGVDNPSRIPWYFPEHENATSYHPLLERLASKGLTDEELTAISYKNALRYLERLWGESVASQKM